MSARRFIGGTDLGACVAYFRPELAHFSPYATAADLWMRLCHETERPQTAAMKRGLDAEPRLQRAYIDAYGGVFEEHERPWRVMHSRLPFVGCSPDDVWSPHNVPLLDDDGERVYVEWKTANWFTLYPPPGRAPTKWGDAETDNIPPGYQLQVQLNLECLDLEQAHLFVGFGTDETDADGTKRFLYRETRRYPIARDRELMALALDYAERFHAEYVVTRTPPSVEPRDNLRLWKRLMKEQPWKTTEASPP
jgi:hypothetical protein